MVSFKAIFAAAASIAVAVAQAPVIAFTSVPAVVVAGNQYNITWGGGDGESVTLTLRKGNPNNLQTIAIIASQITDSYYQWTPDASLATASDYALMITQGVSGINYSGAFSLVGGTGSSSISYSGATMTATANSSTNGTITTNGITMARTTASAGMNITMTRNGTFSAQTLTSGKTITTAASTATQTSTVSATSTATGNVAAAGTKMGSFAAMVIGILGAVMFLQ